MHKTAFAVALAFAVTTFGTSSLYAATDGATAPDAITGATKKRESHSGAFRLTDTKEGQTLLREMVRDFIWTGDTVFDGNKIQGGRQMFGIATSYNNVPENITAELTTDYDEATGTFTFYGTTAKDSGKILRASKSGTGVSVSWVKQLRENEQADWGWNYYDSYGISFDADLEVIRGADLNTGDEAKTKATLKRLGEIMDKSLVTIKEWSLLWKFDPALKGEALEKAREGAIRDFMSYEDVYVVKPRSMIVIGYFARPLMVNANNAFVYRDYALDSSKAGFKLEESAGYKAAVRDTNCICTYTPEERARYNFFDGRFPADSPKNLMNRMKDYKNTVVFGTATPAKGAAPTTEALKAVEGQYNNGGKLMTKAEVDKSVAAAEGVKKTYYWSDETKDAAMPDRFMVTYTGKDSNGKPFRVDLPNWNRWFALQPNNTCGLATRHTIEFR